MHHLHIFRCDTALCGEILLRLIENVQTDIQVIQSRWGFANGLVVLLNDRVKCRATDLWLPIFKNLPPAVIKAYVLQILSDCLFTDYYVILLVVFINKKCLDGRLLSQSRIRQGIYLLHESYLRRQRVQIDHGRCFSPTVSCSRGDLFNSLE